MNCHGHPENRAFMRCNLALVVSLLIFYKEGSRQEGFS